VDHAVAGEPVVVGIAGLELRIGAGAVEGSAQLARDLADHLEVEIVLGAHGGEIARQIGIDANLAVHGVVSLKGRLSAAG
jgi:phosphoenolpyruvate carboxylase